MVSATIGRTDHFDLALRTTLAEWRPNLGGERLRFVAEDGLELPMDPRRWLGEPRPEELELLDLALSAVLDVGCGPGRHAAALARRGLEVLALDVAPFAVELARRRGVRARLGSVFDPLPLPGTWGSALLLDGNLGIGGDPLLLLRRVKGLIRGGGRALVEVERPGVTMRSVSMRIVAGGISTPPLPWAIVGAEFLPRLAESAGFELASLWSAGGRWFGRLDAP